METIVFFQTGQPVIARRKLAGVAAHARKAGWRVVAAEKTTRPFDVAARIRAAARADAAAVPDVPIVRTAVSDFTAMVFLLLAAAQSSRRGGGTK